jgi:hypothetical protein
MVWLQDEAQKYWRLMLKLVFGGVLKDLQFVRTIVIVGLLKNEGLVQ